jgi:predicted transcriptional regulator
VQLQLYKTVAGEAILTRIGGVKMSTKEAVLALVQRMPDDATAPEILEELHLRLAIDEGLRQLDAGQGIDHEEVKRRLSRWLA